MPPRTTAAGTRIGAVAIAIAAVLALLVPTAATAQDEGESYAHTVTSIAPDAIDIDIHVYRPAGASADSPVPVLLHSHGWGGAKTSGANAFGAEREAGFGVVSISQRGHGNSGGLRNVEDPDLEGQDMIAVVDYVASLDWVAKEPIAQDSPFNSAERNGDPVMGAWGGSYGGGYQYVLALTEMRDFGATRVDAMAPDITWHNLNDALAPNDVPRSAWLTALYATATGTVAPYIDEAFRYGVATGDYADENSPRELTPDLKSEFFTHGPAGYRHDDGSLIQLDVPTLLTQGFADNLFIFNEAWHNFTRTLTDEAREQSFLIGHNGGHALPSAYPLSTPETYAAGDACSGNTTAARMAFFNAVFAGENPREDVTMQEVLGTDSNQPFHYTAISPMSTGGRCLHFDTDDIESTVMSPLEVDVTGTVGPATGNVTMIGAPISLPLTEGPVTVAGVPELTGQAYALGVNQRAFLSLAVGYTPEDARPIQNNMMPIRLNVDPLAPALGEDFFTELPGVAIDVPAGQSLYLMVSPFHDMAFGHGSRSPGAIGFTDLEVTVPVLSAE